MSQWKLVEAEPEVPTQMQGNFQQGGRGGGRGGRGFNSQQQQQQGGYQGRGGRGGYQGRGRGRGGYRYNNYSQYQQPYVMTPADCVYFAFMAVQQIELIFMPDNLCMDTFIRSYMDVEGYVPLALLCSYPNVGGYQAPLPNIIARLQETAETSRLEVDPVNETVRLKEGWEQWLVPNQMGTKGVPRYIKQTLPAQEVQGFVDAPTDGTEVSAAAGSEAGEGSSDAPPAGN